MTTFVMYAAAIISVAIVIFMLIKKMDIKITLFLMGIVLMFVGCALGKPAWRRGFCIDRVGVFRSFKGNRRSV